MSDDLIKSEGHLRKCTFSAIAASVPCSNPHVLSIHSGSARGTSLLSRKKSYFRRHPKILREIENTRLKKGAIVRKNAEKESKDSGFTTCKIPLVLIRTSHPLNG